MVKIAWLVLLGEGAADLINKIRKTMAVTMASTTAINMTSINVIPWLEIRRLVSIVSLVNEYKKIIVPDIGMKMKGIMVSNCKRNFI